MCLIMINLQKFKMIIKQKNLANYSFAEKEIAKLFSEFGFKIIDNSPQSICNKFIETAHVLSHDENGVALHVY